MGQMGFFDLSSRYEGLDGKGDPLQLLSKLVPWEAFRSQLQAALKAHGLRTPAAERKSAAGRKPWDEVLVFKALVLQALYNLSDEQTEYQIRDRLSFMRFLKIGLEDRVPDATSGGQIVDASVVTVPRQRNTLEENAAIKDGETPPSWTANPPKLHQKDLDARWTQKNGRNFYGYKNHISIDRKHKLVRLYAVSDASQHDSRAFEEVLDWDNSSANVWADSAYRSAAADDMLMEYGLRNHVHRRAARAHPLSERQRTANTARSRVRARVEHVFGHQANSMGGKVVRTIGLVRARMKVGMMNLAYNMSRLACLHRLAASPA